MKVRETIGAFLIIIGLLLIAGAAGGYEQNICSLGGLVKIIAGGFGCMFVGWLLGNERG